MKAQGRNEFQSSLWDTPLNFNRLLFEQVLLENADRNWYFGFRLVFEQHTGRLIFCLLLKQYKTFCFYLVAMPVSCNANTAIPAGSGLSAEWLATTGHVYSHQLPLPRIHTNLTGEILHVMFSLLGTETKVQPKCVWFSLCMQENQMVS